MEEKKKKEKGTSIVGDPLWADAVLGAFYTPSQSSQ